MNRTIVIRDRRQRHQFSIHNRLIDDWLPIIDHTGLALYSLFVRMANARDERCWTAYSTIAAHLRVSKSTVSDHNRLLAWCRLIHIEAGNQRRANNYYILDVPALDTDLLHHIRYRASHADPPLRFDVFSRLDTWRPIQDVWQARQRYKLAVLRPGQMHLPLSGTAREPSGTLREPCSTLREPCSPPGVLEQSLLNNPNEQSNNNSKAGGDVDASPEPLVQNGWDLTNSFNPEQDAAFQDLLRWDVRPQAAAEIVTTHAHQLPQIQAWIDHTRALIDDEQEIRNPAGFIVAGIRSKEAAMILRRPYRYQEKT